MVREMQVGEVKKVGASRREAGRWAVGASRRETGCWAVAAPGGEAGAELGLRVVEPNRRQGESVESEWR